MILEKRDWVSVVEDSNIYRHPLRLCKKSMDNARKKFLSDPSWKFSVYFIFPPSDSVLREISGSNTLLSYLLCLWFLKPCPHWTYFGKTYRDHGNFSHFKSSVDSPGRLPLGYFSGPVWEFLLANFCQGRIPKILSPRRKVQCGQCESVKAAQ